ncbi:MAG TPA: M2 family metallopeptidase [Bacillota bacterium]|nr:M2 family metallopeptidase [Bacillota bacterium]
MTTDIRAFVDDRVESISNLAKVINLATWNADTTGDSGQRRVATEARKRLAQLLSDPGDYRILREAQQAQSETVGTPDGVDPLLAREVSVLARMYARNQMTPEEIAEQTDLQAEITDIFVHFRADLEGQPASENDINQVLAEERDNLRRLKAWEASKQIGREAAPKVVELVEARNRAARRMGYRNYYSMSLANDELDETWLFTLVDSLAAKTDAVFASEKARLDRSLAAKFGVEPEQIGPWHYSDPFFQRAPADGSVDLDPVFCGKDLPALARRFYDGIGMEVDDILSRSDLYERPGKYQHAYCEDMDREGDIRVICNLRDNHDWMSTLLHELGHGVYFNYIDPGLPYLLREHAHLLTTEAVAMVMGDQTYDARWLTEIAGVEPARARELEVAAARVSALESLIFIRWCLVMVNFERALYASPRRNLNTLWGQMVSRYQLVQPPAGRDEPDWAAKIHMALYPVYYQNYMLGQLLSVQFQSAIARRFGTKSLTGMPEAGRWLIDSVLGPGAKWHWNEMIQRATGSGLSDQPFVNDIAVLNEKE